MENKKEYCKSLYQEYKELKEKTKIEVKEVGSRGEIEAQYINLKDIEDKEKVINELEGCLDFLTEDELKELFTDDHFMGKAIQILTNRKKYQK
jgi:uncharacterized protein with ACT and thioredoxin-like domain